MGMFIKEVHQPVVDLIRNVKLSQFIQKCRVPYSIKSFREVQEYDSYLRMPRVHVLCFCVAAFQLSSKCDALSE